MRLIDLPLELLSAIWSHVQPADIVNFALVCKHLHLASRPALRRHQNYMQQYGKIGKDGLSEEECDIHLPDLLKLVLQNPRISHYIRSLSLREAAMHWAELAAWDDPDSSSQSPELYAQSRAIADRELFSDWEKADSQWSEYHELKWFKELIEDGGSIVAPLLISRLTNLNTLIWLLDEDHPAYTPMRAFQQMIARPGINPFSRLHTVILRKDHDDDLINPEIMYFFMTLPSVEFVHSQEVQPLDYSDDATFPAKKSNVSSLALFYRLSFSQNFDRIIGNPRALKKFVFMWSNHANESDPTKGVEKALRKHTRECLQELTLCNTLDGITGPKFPGRWSDFANLRCFGTDLYNFVPYNEDNWGHQKAQSSAHLVRFYRRRLPPSLEQICLYEGYLTKHLLPLLEGLRPVIDVHVKEVVFPKLQQLSLVFVQVSSTSETMVNPALVEDVLSDSCQATNLELSVSYDNRLRYELPFMEGRRL